MTTRHMTNRKRSVGVVGALLLAGGLLSACGSGDQGGVASGGAPEEFGLTLAMLDKRIESTEQLIATCMRDAGFDYIALDAASVKAAMSSDKSAPGMSSEEYLSRYGLGITTRVDNPLVVFGAGPENAAHLDGLSPADQVAFRRALWGESPEMNHARAIEEEDLSATGGCTRDAAAQTYSTSELSGSYLNPADRLVAQDPRMVTALTTWSECMRADAFLYATPDDVDADLIERFAAITNGQDPSTLTGPGLDQLQALQDEERAIAAAMTACEERVVEPVQAQIENELFGSTN